MKHTLLMLLILVMMAACAPSAAPTEQALSQPTAVDQATTVPTTEPAQNNNAVIPSPTAESLAAGANAAAQIVAYNGPDWTSIPLVDSRTGETFTLADFQGKTVYIEPMATWCTNCRRQLGDVRAAREQLNNENVVFVSFSVAENVSNETLADYADTQGWPWIFAVAPENLLEGMVNTYGRTVISPPSTPHFILSSDGTPGPLVTGYHDPAAIITEINSAITG